MNELVARARAASRRALRRDDAQRGDPIEIGELLIDPHEVQAFVDGESAGLTPTEFRLLYQLALDRGRVVTRTSCCRRSGGGARRTATARSTSSSGGCATRSTAAQRGTHSSRPVTGW